MKSESIHTDSVEENLAEEHLGLRGRLISGSKTIYRYDHKGQAVVFNANLVVNNKKIWWGDLNLTLDAEKLQKLAKALNTTLSVYYENDVRFDNEHNIDTNRRLVDISPISVNVISSWLVLDKKGRIIEKTVKLPKQKPVRLDESNYVAVKLPPVKSLDRGDPVGALQRAYVKAVGNKEEAARTYPSLYVPASYYKQLRTAVKAAFKKTHPGIHPARLENSVSWHLLDIGPNSFQNKQRWEKPNTGYVRKK